MVISFKSGTVQNKCSKKKQKQKNNNNKKKQKYNYEEKLNSEVKAIHLQHHRPCVDAGSSAQSWSH